MNKLTILADQALALDQIVYPNSPIKIEHRRTPITQDSDDDNFQDNLKQEIIIEKLETLTTAYSLNILHMNSTLPLDFWRTLIPNFNKILDHGCWCSALAYNKFPNSEPIDQLDLICQNWSVCRRCTRESELR